MIGGFLAFLCFVSSNKSKFLIKNDKISITVINLRVMFSLVLSI